MDQVKPVIPERNPAAEEKYPDENGRPVGKCAASGAVRPLGAGGLSYNEFAKLHQERTAPPGSGKTWDHEACLSEWSGQSPRSEDRGTSPRGGWGGPPPGRDGQ